jgi:type IV secretion system protein VirB6
MLYERLFDSVNNFIAANANDNAALLVGWFYPIFRSMIVIYVAWWGITNVMGLQNDYLRESFFRVLKVTFILSVALNAGVYNPMIANMFIEGPEELARIFLATDRSMLDDTLNRGMQVGNAAWADAGMRNFGAYIIALLIYGTTVAVTAFCAFLIMLAQIGIAILVSVGPVFIALVLFESTKKYFEAWLGQCVNFFLLYIFTFLAISIFISVFEGYTVNMLADTPTTMRQICEFIVIGLCFILVLRQVPGLASALGGGIQLSTLGGFGAAAGFGIAAAKLTGRAASKSATAGRTAVKQGREFANRLRQRSSGAKP